MTGVSTRLAGWLLGAALVTGCTESRTTLDLSSLPLAEGRPEGASTGPGVAIVVAVRGDVKVRPSRGDTFVARPAQQLLADDRIVTSERSFVIVQLHNGHFVRLHDGSELRVDALAAFLDPPAGDDLEARFFRMLAPEERGDAELGSSLTRVAGWNMRMNAAQTIGPERTPERAPEAPPAPTEPTKRGGPADVGPVAQDEPTAEPTRVEEQDEDKPRGDGGEDRPTTDARPGNVKRSDAPGSPPSLPRVPDASRPGELGGVESGQDDGTDTKKAESKTKPESDAALDLPNTVVFKPDDGGKQRTIGLPGPLRAVRAELARCVGAGKRLRAHVVGKTLTELLVAGKPSSECMALLTSKTVAEPDGWIELQVRP